MNGKDWRKPQFALPPRRIGPWKSLVAAWILHERGGTRVHDYSGFGAWGTLVNNAVFQDSAMGGGVYLDGVDDYINIPSALSHFSGNRGTVLIGARVDALDSSGVVLFGSNTTNSSWFQLTGSVSFGWGQGSSVHVPTIGKPLQYGWTSDGAKIRVFEDEYEVESYAAAGTAFATGPKDFHLGNWIGGSAWDMQGYLSYAYVFADVLNSREIGGIAARPFAAFDPRQRRVCGLAGGGSPASVIIPPQLFRRWGVGI